MTAKAKQRQFALDFPSVPSFAPEDFFRTPSNTDAVRALDAWPGAGGQGPHFLLHGPPGSGKTHLGHVWLDRVGGVKLTPDFDVSSIRPGISYWLDDWDRVGDHAWLFHLLNWVRECGAFLLLSGRQHPNAMSSLLADVRSRLMAAGYAMLHDPDDMLLHIALQKMFADRQLKVDQRVIDFILLRAERNIDHLRALVGAADKVALADRRSVTIPLMKGILDALTPSGT